ncbi:MAG: helix-turn-helix domain-containing protein, partial [Thermoplasmatota archaeon]
MTLAALAIGAVALVAKGMLPHAVGLVGALPLYNRLNRNASLDNDTRRRIFDYVKNMPGSCIADIAERVGVSHSTASYHLDKLCSFQLLTSTADGNKVRFFI